MHTACLDYAETIVRYANTMFYIRKIIIDQILSRMVICINVHTTTFIQVKSQRASLLIFSLMYNFVLAYLKMVLVHTKTCSTH